MDSHEIDIIQAQIALLSHYTPLDFKVNCNSKKHLETKLTQK